MNDEALPRADPTRFLAATLLLSLAGHGLFLSYLEARKFAPVLASKPVELTMIDVPPPPPPKVEEPPEPEPPKPEPVKVKVKPPPVQTAENTPKPPDDAPPPPNEEVPPEPDAKPPLVVGISMSSTTTGGSFAAPIGNTVYGKTANKAANPGEVKSYSAPRYVPASQVDSEPEVLSRYEIPPKDYPVEAKKNGIEGEVLLSITVDYEGKVTNVRVIRGMGYGLDEAAREAIRRFKFKPGIKRGEPVTTDLQYKFHFVLD